jgi:hypothetical protein
MFEGTDLFESDPTSGLTIDPNTGDVTGVGAGAPSSSSMDSWLGNLKDLGGKALDAYKSYVGLEQQRANVDAAAAASAQANADAARGLKFKSDLLGFSQKAELARSATAAAQAQQGLQSVLTGGGGLSIGLVLLIVGGFLLLRRS